MNKGVEDVCLSLGCSDVEWGVGVGFGPGSGRVGGVMSV